MAWSGLGRRGHLVGVGTDPILARPNFLGQSITLLCSVIGGLVGGWSAGSGQKAVAFGRQGRRLPWFWGGNTSIPCRGFGGVGELFCHFGKNAKMAPKPLHGMGVLVILAILSKWAKTRCVSDLHKSNLVRHAASFGYFGKK